MKKVCLNKEELSMEKELEQGKWVPVPDMEDEIKKYQSRARSALSKDKKINIRLSSWDYHKIKAKAAQEGLPYQTLVSSLIHKYLTGDLKKNS